MHLSLFFSETVLGALARVLREDSKKSTELATNIDWSYVHGHSGSRSETLRHLARRTGKQGQGLYPLS